MERIVLNSSLSKQQRNSLFFCVTQRYREHYSDQIKTCWKDAKAELESFDIIYKDDSVVVDTKKSPTLITANGPDSAIKFGEEINKFI